MGASELKSISSRLVYHIKTVHSNPLVVSPFSLLRGDLVSPLQSTLLTWPQESQRNSQSNWDSILGGHLPSCTPTSSILLAISSWILHQGSVSDVSDQEERPWLGDWSGWPCKYNLGFCYLSPFVSLKGQQSLLVKLGWKTFHHKIISKQAIYLFPQNLPPRIVCLEDLRELQAWGLNPMPEKVGMNSYLFSPGNNGGGTSQSSLGSLSLS